MALFFFVKNHKNLSNIYFIKIFYLKIIETLMKSLKKILKEIFKDEMIYFNVKNPKIPLRLKSGDNYPIYHSSFTSAIKAALKYAKQRGYEYDEQEVENKIGYGSPKPSPGKTNRYSISLKKSGKIQKKNLNIQIFNLGTENLTFELNCYIS
jgi:hypothetical protein